MKYIIFFCLLFVAGSAYSQGGWTRPNTSYGARMYRGAFDSALLIPTGTSAAALHAFDLGQSAIYYNRTTHTGWLYNPDTGLWQELASGGGGSTTFSDLNFGYGFIVFDDNPYNPTGPPRTVVLDTAAINNYIDSVIRTDTSISQNVSTFDYVVDTVSNDPPVQPDGYKVLVGTAPTGAFSGQANRVATKVGGVYTYVTATTNQSLEVRNPTQLLFYKKTATGWARISVADLIGGITGIVQPDIGTIDSNSFAIKTHNINVLKFDENQNMYAPKFKGISSHNFAKYDSATGRFTYDIFHPFSLTTIGTSGPATFDTATGVLNVPQYAGGGTQDLQSVTDIGYLTTNPLVVWDGAAPLIGIANFAGSGMLSFGDAAGNAVNITANLPTGTNALHFPNANNKTLVSSVSVNGGSQVSAGTDGNVDITVSSSGGTVTGGVINWPGTIYSTPTTGSVGSGTLTFAPSLASQSAYTVFGNHTSGSAAPTFGKLPIQSVSATGTPSATTALFGDGSWKTVSVTGVSGQVTVFNGTNSVTGYTNYTYDNTNTRLELGATTPTHTVTLDSTRASSGFALYRTVDQTTNYERLHIYSDGASQRYWITSEKGGTGVLRSLYFSSTMNIDFTTNTINSTTFSGTTFSGTTGVLTDLRADNFNPKAAIGGSIHLNTTGYGITTTTGSTPVIDASPQINPAITNTFTAPAFRISPAFGANAAASLLIFDVGSNTVAGGTGTHTSVFSIARSGLTTITKPISFTGTTPSITAGTGAGTSPTISITGNDAVGYVSITTGTSPTASGDIVTITFATALTNTPTSIQLTPVGANSATEVTKFYVDQSASSTTSWKIKNTSSALTASTAYKFYYTVTQ